MNRGDESISRDPVTTAHKKTLVAKRGLSVNYLVGTATAGKGFRFGLEGETHTQNVAHGFLKGIVTFEMRVRVNVCMYFHIYVVLRKQVTQVVRNFNTLGYLYQHPFFDAVLLACFFIVNEHESTMSFTKKNDHGCKFCFGAFYL